MRDKDARIAVTQHIPTIFHSAKLTIVVRDGGGPAAWPSDPAIQHDIEGLDNYFMKNWISAEEGVLSRLWLLQEIILSDKIKFVRRVETPPPESEDNDVINWIMIYNNPLHFLLDLHNLSRLWATFSSEPLQKERLDS